MADILIKNITIFETMPPFSTRLAPGIDATEAVNSPAVKLSQEPIVIFLWVQCFTRAEASITYSPKQNL